MLIYFVLVVMHAVHSNRQGIRRKYQVYHRSNIVVKVIMPRTGQPGNCNSTTDRTKRFFVFKLSRLSLEPAMPPVHWVLGWSGRGLNVAIYLYIVQRLRILGDSPAPSSRAKVWLHLNRAYFFTTRALACEWICKTGDSWGTKQNS